MNVPVFPRMLEFCIEGDKMLVWGCGILLSIHMRLLSGGNDVFREWVCSPSRWRDYDAGRPRWSRQTCVTLISWLMQLRSIYQHSCTCFCNNGMLVESKERKQIVVDFLYLILFLVLSLLLQVGVLVTRCHMDSQ